MNNGTIFKTGDRVVRLEDYNTLHPFALERWQTYVVSKATDSCVWLEGFSDEFAYDSRYFVLSREKEAS